MREKRTPEQVLKDFDAAYASVAPAIEEMANIGLSAPAVITLLIGFAAKYDIADVMREYLAECLDCVKAQLVTSGTKH